MQKEAVVFRMGGLGERNRLLGSVCDEQLLAGNADAFSAAGGPDLNRVILKPAQVAVEPGLAGGGPGQLGLIHEFFQNWRANGVDHRLLLVKENGLGLVILYHYCPVNE
jgi:hypothetical protein